MKKPKFIDELWVPVLAKDHTVLADDCVYDNPNQVWKKLERDYINDWGMNPDKYNIITLSEYIKILGEKNIE